MSGRNEKGSTRDEFTGRLHAETGPCGGTYLLARAGWSSRFPPSSATSLHSPMRRGRLAVGAAGPLHPCHAGVMPAAIGTGMNAGLHALRLRGHAHLNLVGSGGRIANAGSCASAAVYWRRLFLARWIRLPRRHMGSRGRVRPDRLRHPRGLRGAAEAKPCEEMGAMLLKHRHGGFVGDGNLYMHAVSHSVRVLTDGSGETASTPKIVSDVPASRLADG